MTLSKFEKLIKNWEIVLITVCILFNNNFSEKRSVKMIQIGVLPHWNVSYFDVLHDQMHCWMLLHSRETHKYMVFHPCGIVNVFLSFQVESRLCYNFRTESTIGNMNIWEYDTLSNHFTEISTLNNLYLLTVHRWGFSPVCLLICTTNIYWALKGFSSLEHSFHWHTKDFLLAPMCSLFKCCKIK